MLSTFPAVSSSDELLRSQFPAFQGCFPPWDCCQELPIFQQLKPISTPHPNHEPVYSNSGSGSNDSNPRNINLNPCFRNEENRKRNSSESSSDDPTLVMERKRRRMISNRESARRSRMRKQKHLENLRNEVNRLKDGNRNLLNRLRVVIQHDQIVRRENERLEMEIVMLQQKLWDIRQLLLVRQLEQQFSSSAWSCNNNFTPL